jgi:hypothetical protein
MTSHQAKPPVASPYDYGWQKGSNGPTPISNLEGSLMTSDQRTKLELDRCYLFANRSHKVKLLVVLLGVMSSKSLLITSQQNSDDDDEEAASDD